MKLLVTSIGKRVQLIEYLKQKFTVIGADASEETPARVFVDQFYHIHRCTEEEYIEDIIKICQDEKITILIPLYELEFHSLNQNRERIEQTGAKLLLSEQPIIDICNHKGKTAIFFETYQIPSPEIYTDENKKFPAIIKPIDGMGSKDVFEIFHEREYKFFLEYIEHPIVQEYVIGTEYTIDVLCDLEGEPIFIIPRERLEVRAGEVSKSCTVHHEPIIKATQYVIACLRKEGHVMGPLTIQCFLSKEQIKFIEINPRFGGGVPLSFVAGADYAEAIEKMYLGEKVKPRIGEFKEIRMMRYDQAVFETFE